MQQKIWQFGRYRQKKIHHLSLTCFYILHYDIVTYQRQHTTASFILPHAQHLTGTLTPFACGTKTIRHSTVNDSSFPME